MKRLVLALALIALPGAAMADPPAPPPADAKATRNSYANPSAVIAAELAFARDAATRGQWTAFAQFAAPDAVMFVPQMVWAQQWLKGRANPAVAVKWQPHEVWSSCDGSLVISRGAWQDQKAFGYFTTIWQRQFDGSYKWVFDHGDALKEPLDAPEMLAAHIADCPPRPKRMDPPPRGKPKKLRESGAQPDQG